MIFKKYSEIENTCNEKFVRELREQGCFDPSIEYVCENKIDGSNVQCSIDENGNFKFGSRTQEYAPGSDFQGSNNCFLKERVKEKLIQMKKLIHQDHPEFNEPFILTVYGELCGGMYRHPDIEKVKGSIKIQGRVDYHPDNKWVPFDIVLRRTDGITIMVFDQDDVVKYCKAVDLPYPIILFRGTADECMNYPVEFIDKTGNILWGLPIIENNISEGIVIKPNKALWKPNGQRVILKKKGEKFKERICKNKEPKEVLPMTEVEQKWYNIVIEFITESRLMSVLSKIDTSKINDKMFGMILGMFLKDMWKDFYKECEKELLDEILINAELNFDRVRKEASKYATKLIQPIFLKMLGR